MNSAATPQPDPQGTGEVILFGVQTDMLARADFGLTKYGELLHAFNGRDPLEDAYQEAIDLVMYLKQLRIEKEDRDAALASLIRAIVWWALADEPAVRWMRREVLIDTFRENRKLLDGKEQWDALP